jgi:rod shape-determining protein MreD
MRRFLALYATLVLLWALVAQANHALAPFHIYLFAGGLFVAYSALGFPLRSGLAASFLAGLMFDANEPVAFGTHAILFAAAHALLFHLRDRLPREDRVGRVVIALLANFGLFLALSFIMADRPPVSIWPRLLADLVCSQIALALAAPWFFALQSRVLILAGTETESLL